MPATVPDPRMSGYSYTSPAKLKRTPMSNGSHWQRMLAVPMRRQFSCQYEVDSSQLADLMDFLHDEGFSESPSGQPDWWINVRLICGDNAGEIEEHICRCIADPKIRRIGNDDYVVELTYEDRVSPESVTWLVAAQLPA